MSRIRRIVCAVAVWSWLLASMPGSAHAATITEIGGAGASLIFVSSVNDHGEVTGVANFSTNVADRGRAFRWKNGTLTNLDVLGSGTGDPHSVGADINNDGTIVGDSATADPCFPTNSGFSRAATWSGSLGTGLDGFPNPSTMLCPSPKGSVGRAINEAGWTTGSSYLFCGSGSRIRPFRVQGTGPPANLRADCTNTTENSIGIDINAGRSVLVQINSGGDPSLNGNDLLIAANGTTTQVPVDYRDYPGFPHPLSDAGVIVGPSASDHLHAIRIEPGGATSPLPPIDGKVTSVAGAIDEHDHAVGFSGDGNPAGTLGVATMWTGTTPTDLNAVLPPDSGWQLWFAADISPDGSKIVGVGTKDGAGKFFLLDRAAVEVNDPGDAHDQTPGDGVCADSHGACTLRAAIEEVNDPAVRATPQITFAVPGTNTIPVPSALPSVTRSGVTLDGTTQPGGTIRLQGPGVDGFPGLRIEGSGSTLKGLVIGGFGGSGIVLAGDGGHTVTASAIGTVAANGGDGVHVESSDNRVGGDLRPVDTRAGAARADANTIANNAGAGVAIVSGSRNQAAGNIFTGNGGLAIDLGATGLTPNDIKHPVPGGANDGLRAPTITSVAEDIPAADPRRGDPDLIWGSVFARYHGVANTRYGFAFFTSPDCSSQYPRDNTTVLGGTEVARADADGEIEKIKSFAFGGHGSGITVVAIDEQGNTSETSNCFVDADEDGLDDQYEIHGADIDRDGVMDVPLDTMGANPRHKDVFLEIDAMRGLQLDQKGIDFITKRLAEGPLKNPDGKPGFTLHVDNGPGGIMDPVSHRKWGALSDADVLPYEEDTGGSDLKQDTERYDLRQGFTWSKDFDPVKKTHFPFDRTRFFHYVQVVRQIRLVYGGHAVTSILGISRGIPASEILLGFHASCPDDTECAGSPVMQASTLMHELGHNLGLTHGGAPGDHINFKPNYFSIMNYEYIPGGYLQERLADIPEYWDYSRVGTRAKPGVDGSVLSLDEKDLNERTGLAPQGGAASRGVLWFCPTGVKTFNTGYAVDRKQKATGPFDWNCDLRLTQHARAPRINVDDKVQKLNPNDDWSIVTLRGGALAANPDLDEDRMTGEFTGRVNDDLPWDTLREVFEARAGDEAPPKLTVSLSGRTLVVSASDDTGVADVEVSVDPAGASSTAAKKPAPVHRQFPVGLVRGHPRRRWAQRVSLTRGRHKVVSIVYDAAGRSRAVKRTFRVR